MPLPPTSPTLAELSAASLLDPDVGLPDLISDVQLAPLIQVGPKTLANWRSRKEGPPYLKFGNLVRYSRRAVAEWVRDQAVVYGGAA